jgi:hypothetical protein
MTPRQRNLIWTLIWLSISFAALLLFWSLRLRSIYVEEQFSEISTSAWMFHPHFAGWFTQPFSLYRMDYPEWNTQYRSFIRPTECLSYYVMSLFFGTNYAAYLISNYLYQAGTCALTFYIAVEILKLDRRVAHLLAFLVFVSPAYGQQQTFLISFAVDPMAGFFVIASTAFFLREKFVWAWILIALAVGAKEPAWPFPIIMAILVLFTTNKQLSKRLMTSVAFLLPLVGVIALRAYAFGLAGALKSDQGGGGGGVAAAVGGVSHFHILARLLTALAKWPLGVLTESQQYDARILSVFRYWGYTINAIFWVSLLLFIAWAVYRRSARPAGAVNIGETLKALVSKYGFATCAAVTLAAASLIFPLRFAGDPRYGAPTYPLIFLCIGIVLAQRPGLWTRFVCVSLLVSIGIYGLVLRVSDATHGREVFRTEWQLVAGYLQAIENAGSHPLFVIDDATGGEINSEAIQKFYGPQAKVVRLNDLFKDRDCLLMPEHGEPPVHLDVTAQRASDRSIIVHSEITGCGGHNFLGVPQLPPGKLERTDQGFVMSYQIDPRSSPQPTSGKPRELEVIIENAPADSIIVAPDFEHRTYKVVPIGDVEKAPATVASSHIGSGQRPGS